MALFDALNKNGFISADMYKKYQQAQSLDTRNILGKMVQSGQGLTPEQRTRLFSDVMRLTSQQGNAAGTALGRRSAAQGISGTGLANSGLSGLLSQITGQQQQGLAGLNQQDISGFQNALSLLTQLQENARQRKFQEEQSSTGFGGFLGGVVGSLLGPVGSAVGAKIGEKVSNKLG